MFHKIFRTNYSEDSLNFRFLKLVPDLFEFNFIVDLNFLGRNFIVIARMFTFLLTQTIHDFKHVRPRREKVQKANITLQLKSISFIKGSNMPEKSCHFVDILKIHKNEAFFVVIHKLRLHGGEAVSQWSKMMFKSCEQTVMIVFV
jgi:hypothetical protein